MIEYKGYDDSEPRDNHGMWTVGGGPGGEVGKTATGKKVYNTEATDPRYKNFNRQEHADAAHIHNSIGSSAHKTIAAGHTEAARSAHKAADNTSLIIEYKSLDSLELSDMSKEHRTAVIAHAHYDNIDRFGDISRKGMFTKSWTETKAGNIIFNIDHDKKQQPGKVLATSENEQKAFTKVSFSNSTLGNDTMIMMDEGIIRGASFEFVTEKKADLVIKGKKVRELKEVRHLGTTVTLAITPVNPLAGVVSVNKAELGALAEFKAHIERLEYFCRNTTASDKTIQNIEAELKAAREILSQYDTPDTQLITEPSGSRNDSDSFRKQLLLLNANF